MENEKKTTSQSKNKKKSVAENINNRKPKKSTENERFKTGFESNDNTIVPIIDEADDVIVTTLSGSERASVPTDINENGDNATALSGVKRASVPTGVGGKAETLGTETGGVPTGSDAESASMTTLSDSERASMPTDINENGDNATALSGVKRASVPTGVGGKAETSDTESVAVPTGSDATIGGAAETSDTETVAVPTGSDAERVDARVAGNATESNDGATDRAMSEGAESVVPTASEFTALEELLYDMEEPLDSHESAEEAESYESFLANYRLVISENLRAAKEQKKEQTVEVDSDDVAEIPEENSSSEENADSTPDLTADISFDGGETDKTPLTEETEDSSAHEIASDGEVNGDTDEAVRPVSEDGENNLDSLQINLDDKIFNEKKSEEDAEKYNPEKPRKIDNVFEIVELFIVTLVCVMVVTSIFFRHSVVDGSSMQNTLQDGDHLIISSFLYTPDYGDIVVFEDTESSMRKALVKRVIALPGDTVEIKRDGSVYVNGELLNEDYVFIDEYISNYVDEENIWTVGEGEVFVLGDHRNVSADSRKFGTIDADTILGKAVLRFFPFSEFGIVK